MSQFIPKRIFVKPQSLNTPKAKEIIARAQTLDPSVQIIKLRTKNFQYPSGFSPKDKFFFMKDSVVLSERTEPFITTFASPGNIVEDFNTVLNYTWMCPLNCEFCYLQTNQTLEHYFYTNLHELEKEFVTAPYAHWAILTIWSMLSFAKQQIFLKIPPNLEEYSDKLRHDFAESRMTDRRRIIDWLYLRQGKIYKNLKGEQSLKEFGIKKELFNFSRETIEKIYEHNASHRLRMIPSEFCDMVAVDHLTKNISHLANLVAKSPDIDIDIRTKASQLDDIRSFSGHGRITFLINLNTEYVINKYEHGTASLDERLSAARTVQEADGYHLRLVIEPYVKYKGCTQDYLELIRKISKVIDLKNVTNITLGSVRYRKQLRERINRNFPSTDLFSSTQELQEPENKDYRLRYSLDYLTSTYTTIRNEIAKYTQTPVSLGAEKPELWQRLQIDARQHLSKSVYQYSEKAMNNETAKTQTDQNEETKDVVPPVEADENEVDEIDGSICFNCALQGINDDNLVLLLDPFQSAEQQLNNLQYTTEVITAQDGNSIQGEIDLWDTIDPVTIKVARRPENIYCPVKVTGRLAAITAATPLDVKIDGIEQTIPAQKITFEDRENTKIQTLAYPEGLLPSGIDQYLKSKKLLTFLGCIIIVMFKETQQYRFYLRKIITNPLMTDLVGVQKASQTDTKFTVNLTSGKTIGIPENDPYLLVERYGHSIKYKRDGKDLFNYIKNSLKQNLKLLGTESNASHLDAGLEFVILQALSQGKSDSFSNKLHGLIIGPPNVGKSLLTDGVKAINPVEREISIVGAKITAAGLIGKVTETDKHTISTGGIIPSTSGGTLCIQDFHELSGNKRDTVHDIFSLLMEKGVVRDDTSANTTLDAEVSLLIDTNRYHQVIKSNPPEPFTFADLDIPINILSRYDFILEIPEDAERQKIVSEQIGLKTSLQIDSWKAELKSLIAFLRDEYRGVTISDEIDSYAKAKLKSLFEEFKSENFETNIQDHQPRIARSLKKYVFAISRVWARPVVTEEHIDFALKFIRQKLLFLSNQKFNERKLDGRSKKKEERAQLVIDYFKNSYLTPPKLEEFFKKQYGSVEGINISREIKTLLDGKLIQPVKRAVWKVISSEDPSQPQVPQKTNKSIHKRKNIGKKPIKKRKK